jgi:hypothetical protein
LLLVVSRAGVATGRVAMCVHEGIASVFVVVGMCAVLALAAT